MKIEYANDHPYKVVVVKKAKRYANSHPFQVTEVGGGGGGDVTLYDSLGQNTDGAMTQKAATDVFEPLKGAGAPTEQTVGEFEGREYYDTENSKLYYLAKIENGVYTWKEVGSGSGEEGYWGDLTYYSEWAVEWSAEYSSECTINSIDADKLDAFIAEYGREWDRDRIDFDYEEGNWQFWGEEGRIEIPVDEMLSRTGIDVTVNEGSSWANMSLRRGVAVNTESETITKTLKTKAEFYSLCSTGNSEYSATIDGQEIPNQAFKTFNVQTTPKNTDLTNIPDYFLYTSRNLENVWVGPGITNIGHSCCAYCSKVQQVSINGFQESIGDNFCSACYAMNSVNVNARRVGNYFCSETAITWLPTTERLERAGINYCSNCSLRQYSFSFPSLTNTGDGFLFACKFLANANNITFSFPQLQVIGTGFLRECSNLGGVTTFNAPLLKRVQNSFCAGCTSLVSFAFPSTVTVVGDDFFKDCTSFTADEIVEKEGKMVTSKFSNLEMIGSQFLYNCQRFFYSCGGIYLPNLKYYAAPPYYYSFAGFLYNTTAVNGAYNSDKNIFLGGFSSTIDNYTFSRQSSSSPSFILYDLTEGQRIRSWSIPDRTGTPFRSVIKGGQYVDSGATAFRVSSSNVHFQDYAYATTSIGTNQYVTNIPAGLTAYGDRVTPVKGDLISDNFNNIVSFTGFNADGTWNGWLMSSSQIYQPIMPNSGATPVVTQSGQNWKIENVQNYYAYYQYIFPGVSKLIANGKVYQVIGKNYTYTSQTETPTVTLRLLLG